jgi:hypothetical protein
MKLLQEPHDTEAWDSQGIVTFTAFGDVTSCGFTVAPTSQKRRWGSRLLRNVAIWHRTAQYYNLNYTPYFGTSQIAAVAYTCWSEPVLPKLSSTKKHLKYIFLIPRSPYLWNRLKARKQDMHLVELGYYPTTANCRTNSCDISRDMWHFSWYFKLFWCLRHACSRKS